MPARGRQPLNARRESFCTTALKALQTLFAFEAVNLDIFRWEQWPNSQNRKLHPMGI